MSATAFTQIGLDGIAVAPDRMRMLRPEKVAELAESMAARGLIQPIIVRPSSGRGNGYELIAGRHRFEAAKCLGWPLIASVVFNGVDVDAALLVQIDENLIRADLSPAERALHLRERKRLYETLHPETKHGGDRRSSTRQSGDLKRFTKDAAKKIGQSERSVQREIERAAKISHIADVIDTSLDSKDELDALAKLPEPVQRDLIAWAKAGKPVTAKHVAYKLRREARERSLGAATETASQRLGEKRYAVLYADPPWRFEVHAESGMDRLADNHYPTMPLDDLKRLDPPAADNCVLFLWATVPILSHAFDLMAAWGFTYKSAAFWDKVREGTGYWFRNQVEVLLVGVRGNVPAPALGEQPPQLIVELRGRHSEKPAIFAEHIERLYPTVPKLEMFARKARLGWDCWGNEVQVEAAE
jgi:N6-adenosine-specific RNA methylase IME4/ParB-like chromosome segregation protein Spo0J